MENVLPVSFPHVSNSPIALHWRWSVGAIEVWHLLVIMKGEDPPNNIVTLGHKAWLKAVLKCANFGCRWGWRGEAGNWDILYSEDTERVKQGE